jgi:hypothetical protein
MKIGSLVMTCPRTDYHQLGIVTGITAPSDHSLWYNMRMIKVLDPKSGTEHNWAEEALELIQ